MDARAALTRMGRLKKTVFTDDKKLATRYDPRYVDIARAILTRHGFGVTRKGRPVTAEDWMEQVRKYDPEVARFAERALKAHPERREGDTLKGFLAMVDDVESVMQSAAAIRFNISKNRWIPIDKAIDEMVEAAAKRPGAGLPGEHAAPTSRDRFHALRALQAVGHCNTEGEPRGLVLPAGQPQEKPPRQDRSNLRKVRPSPAGLDFQQPACLGGRPPDGGAGDKEGRRGIPFPIHHGRRSLVAVRHYTVSAMETASISSGLFCPASYHARPQALHSRHSVTRTSGPAEESKLALESTHREGVVAL